MKHLIILMAALLWAGQALAAELAGAVWLAQIRIDKVSEAHLTATTGDTPTPTSRAFNYNLYLYQSASGELSLLPTAGLFYDIKSGKDTECAEKEMRDGMRLYLVTEQAEFYRGCHLRTLINAALPFDGDRSAGIALLAGGGSLQSGGYMAFRASLAADHPVNPFKHLYHPDHGTGREIVRTLSLSDLSPVEGSAHTFAAKAQESVSGLHRQTLYSAGEATLIRIHENVQLGF